MHSVYEINFDNLIAKTVDDNSECTYTFGFIDLEILQFTGLLDMNGNEIYEGDILEADHIPYENGNYTRSLVIFSEGKFMIEYRHKDGPLHEHISVATKERVVGNIFENPTLLENKND